jgi:penicillin G amidase
MNMYDRALARLARLAAGPSRRLLPGSAGERLQRYGADATIARDERGIPWITASCEEDLCFAAGFAQACDRLWQMDLLRRRAQGTLSEVFGSKTAAADVRVRRLAIHRVARAAETALSARGRLALDSFSNGVNTAIRRMARRGALPPEFLLLRYRPRPWTARDSLAIVKMLGFDLSKNLASETFRARLVREAPQYAQAFLEPKYPADIPLTIWPDGTRSGRASGPVPDGRGTGPIPATPGAQRAGEPSCVIEPWPGARLPARGEGGGSNAWVLAGSRTASGSPLLANDPHVGFSQPSLWYQAGLCLTDGPQPSEGYGVTVPGLPGLVCGANQCLAFGITNATVDTQDLCLAATGEQLPGGWAERSMIKVRRGADVPVDSAGAQGCVEIDIPGLPGERWLLFWSGYQPSAEIDGSLRAWRARSYGEFRDALRYFGVPVLNYLVACADGTIALKTAGCVPRRRPGSGLLPAGYAEVAQSWQSFLGFEELPEVVNPAQGYIVSANNKLMADDDRLYLTADWAGAYRAPRINELIRERGRVTARDCARWQMDVMNARARRLLPVLLPALGTEDPPDDLTAACLDLLRGWDGYDHPGLAAPVIFSGLLTDLTAAWAGSRLGPDLADAMPDLSLQVDHLILDAAARSAAGVQGPLGLPALSALQRTATRLARELGGNPRLWRNDRAYVIADGHLLGRSARALAPLFGHPESPVGTSRYSVRLMFPGPSGVITEGAPWRFVAETGGDGCTMWDVLRHGSSGHPLSPHYDDQTAAHEQGRLTEVKPGFLE